MPTTKPSTARTLAQAFIRRAEQQKLKGRARDRAALEFMLGACAAIAAIEGDKSPNWMGVSTVTMLVSVRGFDELQRVVDAHENDFRPTPRFPKFDLG